MLSVPVFFGRQPVIAQGTVCVAPDSSSTALLPADCPYTAPSGAMYIIDGLAPGDTIKIIPTHSNFSGIVRTPGGTLGGESEEFSSSLNFVMAGTGSLSTFSRDVTISISNVVHTGPRPTGNPIQDIALDMGQMQGQVTGDPDFDLLRITAGTTFGMPSPGHTTLTQQPGGNWNVDSFFDITYRIDFVGAPAAPFAGRSGSTTGTIRMQQGAPTPPPIGHELLMGTDNLPPKVPYLSEPDTEVVFPGTLIRLKDLDLSKGSPVGPPPPLSSYQDYTYDAQMRMMLSMDNGASFAPVAATPTAVIVRMTHTQDVGDVRYFDTEMLSLQLRGAGGLMLRESPTRASTGRTTIRTVPGGYMVNSFFDIFTELSLDGGGTWMPSSSSITLETAIPQLPAPELTFAGDDLTGGGDAEMFQFEFSEEVRFTNGASVKKIHMHSLPPCSVKQYLPYWIVR